MFLFIPFTKAFYIFSEQAKEFLSVGTDNQITPDLDGNLLDFYLTEHGSKDGKLTFGTDRKHNKVVDISGNNHSNGIISYKYHGGDNQKFNVYLTPDNGHVIVHRDRCLFYAPDKKKMTFSSCENTYGTLFNFYFSLRVGEDSPTKDIEDKIRPDEDNHEDSRDKEESSSRKKRRHDSRFSDHERRHHSRSRDRERSHSGDRDECKKHKDAYEACKEKQSKRKDRKDRDGRSNEFKNYGNNGELFEMDIDCLYDENGRFDLGGLIDPSLSN